jgi:hypothetical protein
MALFLSFIAVTSTSWLCDDFVDEQDTQNETGEEDITPSEQEMEENMESCPSSFFTNKYRVCMLSAVGLMSALSIVFVHQHMNFVQDDE